MENTMEIMEKNEDNIEKEETFTLVESEEAVDDQNEGLVSESGSLAEIGIAVAVTAAVGAVAFGIGTLVKKGWKAKHVKKIRRRFGNAILKGLDDDVKSDVLPIEVVDETADGDQE